MVLAPRVPAKCSPASPAQEKRGECECGTWTRGQMPQCVPCRLTSCGAGYAQFGGSWCCQSRCGAADGSASPSLLQRKLASTLPAALLLTCCCVHPSSLAGPCKPQTPLPPAADAPLAHSRSRVPLQAGSGRQGRRRRHPQRPGHSPAAAAGATGPVPLPPLTGAVPMPPEPGTCRRPLPRPARPDIRVWPKREPTEAAPSLACRASRQMRCHADWPCVVMERRRRF